MKRLLRLVLPAVLIAAPFVASAQSKLLPACTATGDCGVTDILAVLINVVEYLLGISGAVALLMFVYGGFTFIMAAGDSHKADQAMSILKSAVIGIAIIFLAGVLVRFATQALTGGTSKIPTLGESCNSSSKTSVAPGQSGADGIWVSIPAGKDGNGKVIPESLVCVKKETQAIKAGDPCANLNNVLQSRALTQTYYCKEATSSSNCVRGLCSNLSAQYACCR